MMNTLTKNLIKNNSKDPKLAFSGGLETCFATLAQFIANDSIRKNQPCPKRICTGPQKNFHSRLHSGNA
jgi:hypothetical protein